MPSNSLILCHPLLLLLSIFPSIRIFSNESALCIRWPKYWSFSFNISPSNEHPGLISFRMDWLDLLAVQGTLKSLLQHHSSKASILWLSSFFIVQLSHYIYLKEVWALLVAQRIKNLPSMQETGVWFPLWEDPLEKGTATHSSIRAWRIPWTEAPGRLQPMGSQRVGYNWANFTILKMFTHLSGAMEVIRGWDWNSACLKSPRFPDYITF